MAIQQRTMVLTTSVLVLLLGVRAGAEAGDRAAVLEPFLHDDAFVAAYVDLAALQEAKDVLAALPPLAEEPQAREAVIELLAAMKVEAVYAVSGLGDVNARGGPLVVLHLAEGGQPEAVVRTFSPIAPMTIGPWRGELEMRPHGRNLVLLGTRATLRRYAESSKSARRDLVEPLDKLLADGAAIAVVFSPGPGFRRVVRELWPELPGSLAPLRGELADRWQHFELAINLPPDARPRAALQARDAEAAETFVNLLHALPDATEQFTDLGDRRHELKRHLQLILAAVPPRLDGTRVKIELQEAELAVLQDLASRAADAALDSRRRNERMNKFKQLGLALQIYHDVIKHLPASAAIRSADGTPLLSWRVAILPYIEEGELYKQFRLNEPWDSPHNRKLIEKMPAVFADPDPKLKHLARAGKTTYQVPVGPETAFFDDEGANFREISDGTSKTILVVEVEPERAIVWTKPEDWEVDMQNPRQGVARKDRDYFTAGFADSHTRLIPVDVDEATLRAMLTRAGREVFQLP